MTLLRALVPLIPLLAAGCAGLERNDQGNLQPQTVVGPCQVKKFFLQPLLTTPTTMVVGNTGEACGLTIFNPALQVTLTAALVTTQPSHGRAQAGLPLAGRQASVSYAPQPGYIGPDTFAITLQPSNIGVTFHVTVQATAPAT